MFSGKKNNDTIIIALYQDIPNLGKFCNVYVFCTICKCCWPTPNTNENLIFTDVVLRKIIFGRYQECFYYFVLECLGHAFLLAV